MEQCELKWFNPAQLSTFKKEFDSENFTYRVTAWPMPSQLGIQKFAVYIYPKKEHK